MITPEDITTEPLRRVLSDPPSIVVGSYRFTCLECHGLFESTPRTPGRLTQHMHIVLDHGLNDECLNCHDRYYRNKLALASGDVVSFTEAARLCAECHGTAYRDWQKGMHGRANGYWDATRGVRRQLTCTECHDPHAPALKPMRALPGPDTLRMGEPPEPGKVEHIRKRNPLRQWGTAGRDAHLPNQPPRDEFEHVKDGN
ncbi:MAG: hypothetical protein ACYS0G_00675 [Planctomycetota bacterium]